MTVTIEDRTFTPRPGRCAVSLWRDGAHLICHAAGIDAVTAAISNELRSPVADRTGLTGTYDVNVRFVPEDRRMDADLATGPPLADALQEELGLRLEKGKGPVEVIVIENMEKPTEN
ncbi:MAG TPA: TIGR03435 family protein [Bryobacteraceae bacterium]|nr:TIGR03435 family protein [Bryobacteraceae bacterium]